MLNFVAVVCLLMSLLYTNTLAAGELYKWKDENGITHYSEKKPLGNAETSSIDVDQTSSFNSVETLTKVPASNQNHYKIVIVRPDDFWTIPANMRAKVSYFFGGDCVAPSNETFEQLKRHHIKLLPARNRPFDAMASAIYELGYRVAQSAQRPLPENLARERDPIILRVSLQNLEYHLCVRSVDRESVRGKKVAVNNKPFEYSTSRFKRQRATVSLHWQLQNGQTGDTLFSTTTSGSAINWEQDVNPRKLSTLELAIQNATLNLFADQKFTALLNNSNKTLARTLPRINDTKNESRTTDTINLSYQRKAHFANVLGKISPLKMMLMEYYMSQGDWPKRLDDLGVDSENMDSPGYIEKIMLDYDGSIVVTLDAQRFSKNATLSLTPQIRMSGISIDWECTTNLDESYYNDMCHQVH